MRNSMNNTLLALAASLGFGLTTNLQAAQILLDGEGDSGTTATDKLTADGAQNPTFLADVPNGVTVDNTPANAKFGASSFAFLDQLPGGSVFDVNHLELPNTKTLGSSFTLAAMVKGTTQDRMVVFSSYYGGDTPGNVLLFDVNAGGDSPDNTRMRFLLGTGGAVNIETSTWGSVSDGAYHQVAVTFDNGIVKFYRDGVNVETHDASGQATSYTNGDANLFVGNNTDAGFNQFAGSMDDILVYDRALTTAEISNIYNNGAATLVPEPTAVSLLALGALAMRRRK